eukprot:TRINITY_DN9539_c0_g1_i1.p1 TRINITY_DN9539_c0_g1~~TRINITY_DN9539_c0_g1_i1.p1  ORF type:complete len:226 (+),score=49.07 TRINITY_DN9539_c0_g1_i1:44-721(+)
MSEQQVQLNLKLVVIGPPGMGKTCILHRYSTNAWNPHLKFTVGAECIVKRLFVDDMIVSYNIWDIAGQERFGSSNRLFFRYADAAVIVCDLSDESSFESTGFWIEDFLGKLETREGRKDIPVLIVGNKVDLIKEEERAAKKERLENVTANYSQFFDEFNQENPDKNAQLLGCYLVSAKSGEGVEGIFKEALNFCTNRPNQLLTQQIENTTNLTSNAKEDRDTDCC